MIYQFIVDTYETERIKVLSVCSMFKDEELPIRPHSKDARGRSVKEQMVHQCVSEDYWFKDIHGVDVKAPPLPETETRIEFIHRYAQDSSRRLDELGHMDEAWWVEEVQFFGVERTRAWIMVRRIAHTAHHRGQQTAMLRMLKHDLHRAPMGLPLIRAASCSIMPPLFTPIPMKRPCSAGKQRVVERVLFQDREIRLLRRGPDRRKY